MVGLIEQGILCITAIFLSPLWPTPAPTAPHTPEIPWQRQQQTNKQPEADEWVRA